MKVRSLNRQRKCITISSNKQLVMVEQICIWTEKRIDLHKSARALGTNGNMFQAAAIEVNKTRKKRLSQAFSISLFSKCKVALAE